MKIFKYFKDNFITSLIIFVSITGIIYFSFFALKESSDKEKNPYAYQMKAFEKFDKGMLRYIELEPLEIKTSDVYGFFIAPDDRIYVSTQKGVFIYNNDKSIDSGIDLTEPVYAIDMINEDNLFFAMKTHIEVYDIRGKRKDQWQPLSGKAFITSIALSDKTLFIADAGNRVVWEFTHSGKFVKKIGQKDAEKEIPGFVIPSPYFDLDIDMDGSLWVVNPGRHSFENYTIDGRLRTSWGEYSTKINGFCGCCNPSHFKLLKDGSFVTSEKGIVRVKIYNPMGELIAFVAGPNQFFPDTKDLDLAVDSSNQIYVLDPVKKQVRIFKKK